MLRSVVAREVEPHVMVGALTIPGSSDGHRHSDRARDRRLGSGGDSAGCFRGKDDPVAGPAAGPAVSGLDHAQDLRITDRPA